MSQYKPSGLYVCTTVIRQVDDEPTEYEVVVEFDIVRYTRGSPAVPFGNYPQPAEGPEFEFSIAAIELVLSKFDPPTYPLTPAEKASITAWFWGDGQEAAVERASDSVEDRVYDDYWRDARLERAWS